MKEFLGHKRYKMSLNILIERLIESVKVFFYYVLKYLLHFEYVNLMLLSIMSKTNLLITFNSRINKL